MRTPNIHISFCFLVFLRENSANICALMRYLVFEYKINLKMQHFDSQIIPNFLY